MGNRKSSVMAAETGNGAAMGRHRRRKGTASAHHSDVYDHASRMQPMPDTHELEMRFTKVLASMDLPPDKAKLLKQYDDTRKWEIICDQEKVIAKESPAFYLKKMRTYLDPKASRSAKRRKTLGASTSTQVLRDLEISLRTNNIEWVKEFLNEENKGLEVLIDYLSFRLVLMRTEQIASKASSNVDSDSNSNLSDANIPNYGKMRSHSHHNTLPTSQLDTPKLKRASKHISKLKMGESTDDIHICIMCLRAIMNNKYGFNMVIEHTEVINCIALSLNHNSLRTKALVLELLAAICLVKGGHQIILNAFNNFKEVCSENNRFQTLMHHFMNYQVFNIEFMVACMQFINIVVHSVEDMNFRIYLQFEFTKLGLDEFLEKLRHTESDVLQVQISAYLDNVFDVAGLMHDSETKAAALEHVAELEDQLSMMHQRYEELEQENEIKQLELEAQINAIIQERDKLQELHKETDEELHTLRKVVSKQKEESQNRQSLLESKIQELEHLTNSLPRDASKHSATKGGSSAGGISGGSGPGGGGTGNSAAAPAAPPPPPPPAPPAPPPPPMAGGFKIPGPPAPPPPPGMMAPPGDAMTIKRRVQTKYKLPTLNWIVLKPNQVKGTVFNDLDDDKLQSVIDFNSFEETFKLGAPNTFADRTDDIQGSKRFKAPEKKSVLDHKRLRNMAISLRKIALPNDTIVKAINNIDLQVLSLDTVEILLRMIPTDEETKGYREFEKNKTPLEMLTDEDKFLYQLTKVERLTQKLNIMNYISTFDDNVATIIPQVQAVIAAARSIKNSKKVRKILEVILAFGNYMNSNKRGPAYGFKLQSLDTLLDTKSCDKKQTLLHFIVETVKQKFPDAAGFESELRFIEKASGVSLDNITVDVSELHKGMELCKKECNLRRKDPKDNLVLKDFVGKSEDKLKKLQGDMKAAQEAYDDVVEFFGESSRSVPSNTFFSTFLRFTKSYKQALEDNEYRRKMEEAAREAHNKPSDNVSKKNEINNRKNQQDAVINELKNKTRQVNEKRLLKQDEVYNGALEDILLGLKNEPYRRADAVRRSQRRKQENVRLSRNFDDLEV